VPDPSNEPDLSWLADSPMFIDSQQIGAFYDAVVGPAFRTVELQISAERTGQVETSVTARLGAKLTALFPWLRVDADTEGRRTTTKGRQEGENIVLQPAESATRQLVELSLHYLVNQHDRIRLVGNGSGLPDRDAIGASPRMFWRSTRNEACPTTTTVIAAQPVSTNRGIAPIPATPATPCSRLSARLPGCSLSPIAAAHTDHSVSGMHQRLSAFSSCHVAVQRPLPACSSVAQPHCGRGGFLWCHLPPAGRRRAAVGDERVLHDVFPAAASSSSGSAARRTRVP
jgi:hypothetical protein